MNSPSIQRLAGLPPWSRADDSVAGRWFLDRASARLAWLAWMVLAIVIGAIVAADPVGHSVTDNYRRAAEAWWAGRPLYLPGKDGFLYLPQSAIAYTPFTWPPLRIGEVLYRLVSLGLYAAGCWRVSAVASRRNWNAPFLLVSILAIGVGASALRNGQANIPLSGLMMLGAAGVARGRWWAGACFLAISIVVKPVGIVPLLLFGAVYAPLRWRIALLALAVAILPFLCNPTETGYVLSQYREGFAKVTEAGGPMPRGFAELGSVLEAIRVRPSYEVMTGLRALAALCVLGLAFGARHRHDRRWAAILIWAMAGAYLMVFNPRTEGVSYGIVAPAFGVIAAGLLERRPLPRWCAALAVLLLASGVLMIFVHELQKSHTDLVVRPSLTAVFLVLLGWFALSRRYPEALGGPSEATGNDRSGPGAEGLAGGS